MTELDHARLFIVYHIPTLNELDADFVTDEEREKAIERFSQVRFAGFVAHFRRLSNGR
jgi:hypothetical protein